MPHRNLREQESSTPALRRSPRFGISAIGISVNKTQIEEVSKSSGKSSTRLRGSPRLKSGNLQNKGTVNIESRVTRGSSPGIIEPGCVSTDNSVEKRQTNSGTKETVPSYEVAGCGVDDNATVKKMAQAILKRKRTKAMEESSSSIANGWTNEQELALQSAYFATKPTPNFWKKVAKMVRGKSAQECFDKIHLGFLTPPQRQPRSRAKKTISSFSSCAAKLLLSADKNTNKRRLRNHLSQKKNVRQLLQKQYEVDHRDKEADFFDVLESSTSNPTAGAFFTPELNKKESFLKKCLERSASAHKKQLPRLSGSSTLTSPPVLKPIKNKALHERYIDKLHRREAKRKAATSRTEKGNKIKNDREDDEVVRKIDVIKAAKNALISEARDAIQQFQKSQICAMNNFYDDDGGGGDDDENHSCDEDSEDTT